MPPNPHPQQSLALYAPGERQPSAPPRTRGECGELARPCTRYSCPHNNARDDERAGRPHENGRRANIRLRTVDASCDASCALDVADQGEQGYDQIGKALSIGAERARQLELRGLVKEHLALKLLEWLEPFRGRLPDGCELTVEWPRHGATHSVYAVLEVVVTVDERRIPHVADELGLKDRQQPSPAVNGRGK